MNFGSAARVIPPNPAPPRRHLFPPMGAAPFSSLRWSSVPLPGGSARPPAGRILGPREHARHVGPAGPGEPERGSRGRAPAAGPSARGNAPGTPDQPVSVCRGSDRVPELRPVDLRLAETPRARRIGRFRRAGARVACRSFDRWTFGSRKRLGQAGSAGSGVPGLGSRARASAAGPSARGNASGTLDRPVPASRGADREPEFGAARRRLARTPSGRSSSLLPRDVLGPAVHRWGLRRATGGRALLAFPDDHWFRPARSRRLSPGRTSPAG
ncbi:hypothetical protein EDF36_2995 [Rathayibacter sp. PhB152]|nr:hypothetical protein EDF36_2995 [Rathayibacter sp. PhB152]